MGAAGAGIALGKGECFVLFCGTRRRRVRVRAFVCNRYLAEALGTRKVTEGRMASPRFQARDRFWSARVCNEARVLLRMRCRLPRIVRGTGIVGRSELARVWPGGRFEAWVLLFMRCPPPRIVTP